MRKLAVIGLVCLLVACFVAPALAGTTQGKHGQKWLHYEGNYCVWTWQMTLANNDSWKKEVKMTISLWDANGYEIWSKTRYGYINAHEIVTFSNTERTLTTIYQKSTRYQIDWETY